MSTSDKLLYLNTTKTKIREGLNSLGADLDTEDTFRSYVDAIEGIYEDYPKITGEGESLSLDNTKQASMKIDYKGNTSQDGEPTPDAPIPINVVSGDNTIDICGKNLLPTSDVISTGGTMSNGVTFTRNSDGSITANGTATGAISIYINNNYTELPAGTYTFSDSVLSGESGTTFFLYVDVRHTDTTSWDTYNFSTANTTTGMTQTIPEAFIFKTRIVIRSGQTLNNVVFKPMLEKGSTATTYEPHIGNSYPIYLGVENLYSSTTITDQYTYIMPCNIGDTFTLSFKGSVSSGSQRVFLRTYNGTNPPTSSVVDTSQVYVTTTMNELSVSLTSTTNGYLYIATSASPTNYTFENIQLERGLKVNSYTPYGTTPIELCKIGTYQDYIYKDNGSWYLHKEIGKVVLNGSTTIARVGTGTSGVYRFSVIGPTDMKRNADVEFTPAGLVISDKFVEISNNASYQNPTNGILVRMNNTNNFIINCVETQAYSVADFTTWLQNNNVLVYYVLATPTNTEITDTTLLEQLEESKLSYISQTNISQVNNDLPFILNVKALRGE